MLVSNPVFIDLDWNYAEKETGGARSEY